MAEDGEPSMSRGKGKQKRPPQRGLGVAQLEKIRLEEQHKNSNAAVSSSSSPSPPPPPPPPPSSQPLPLPLNPIVDSSSPPSIPNHPAGISGPRRFLAQWMDHKHDGTPLGLICRCPSFPRVNSMISPTASGICFHMEHPSSQILYHNNHTSQSTSSSSWQEDDRNLVYRTGKRPCENMQNLSPYKIPSVSGSFVRGSPLVHRNMVSRDCMSSCSSYQVDMDQNHAAAGLLHVHQRKKENCFLTLGTRTTASPMRSDISNQYQERVDGDHDTSSYFGCSGPNTCSPYYTFLPLATDVQNEEDIGDCEETKSLDLNLKL